MPDCAVDTNVLIRFLEGDTNLPEPILTYLRDVDEGMAICHIPAVVAMEMLYLFEKGRIPRGVDDVADLLENSNFRLQPLDLGVLRAGVTVDDIPELHDRMIVATAKLLGVPLLTLDHNIRATQHVQTVG
jgi:predicted nucleic acid-binding protein